MTGGAVGLHTDGSNVNTQSQQPCDVRRPGLVGSDAAGHDHRGTGRRSCHSLARALAAGQPLETSTQDGLARLRVSLDPSHKVDVE